MNLMTGCSSRTLLVVDDHDLRRIGVSELFRQWAQQQRMTLRQVGAVQDALAVDPVCLDDVEMCIFSIGGVSLSSPTVTDTLQRVQERLGQKPIVIICDDGGDAQITVALELGVQALVDTRQTAEVAVAALTLVLAGGSFFAVARSELASGSDVGMFPNQGPAPRMGDEGTELRHNQSSHPDLALTARQAEVLDALKNGCTNKMIARNLDIAEATVKIHVRQLMRKLGAINRTQVALFASGEVPAKTDRQCALEGALA